MNAFSQQGEMYRKPKIDDDFDNGKNKKGKKNKAPVTNNNEEIKPVQKTLNNSQDLIKKLQGLFPLIEKDIVADVYKQCNDFSSAEGILKGFASEKESNTSQDSPIEVVKIQSNEENISSEEDKNYDLLQEHDDLYDQLSVILESAFERNDIAESDIDDLLNMCEENVCYLIEEEQKLAEFVQNPDEMIEVDQVTKEIQQFILQQIQKEQKSTIVNTSYSNFPSLSASNTQKTQEVTSPSQYETIIQNESKKVTKKIQPQISNKWASESANNQIHIGIKPGSTKEIIKLCKHFPSLSLTLIKTIYTHLDEDFEFSMKYLMMKYKDAYQSSPAKEKKKVVRKAPRQQANTGVGINQKVDETVEQILRDYTYEDMRQKVQQLTRIKFILDRTATQARSSRKYSEVSSIENAARDQAFQLDKFSKASKKFVLEKARRNKESYQMDLHGLYWDEAKELVAEQINYLANKVPGNESQFKYIDKIRNGRHYIEYCIITGKGNNSRNKIPVLHNNLCSYLKEKNIVFDPMRGEGKIAVYIPL